jgi:hypothetical protein
MLFLGLTTSFSQIGRGLTNRTLEPEGMTRNMVFLEKHEIKQISFIMPIANAVYEVNGQKYFVENVPPFLDINKDQVPGILIIKGKASEEALKESGQRYSYKWFSAGIVTKKLLDDYKGNKNNSDFPLE